MVTLFDSVASPSSWRPRAKLAPTQHNNDDIFMNLPSEIINSIILHMSIDDVLKIRNVSKAFWRLDSNVFRRLIERDFPWFWEFEEFRQTIELWNSTSPVQAHQRELLTSWRSGLGPTRQSLDKQFYEPDWFAVYQQLQILQYKLPGLKNRKRIWALIEEIMYRIETLRENLAEELIEEGVVRLPAIPSAVERYPGLTVNWRDCMGCKNLGQISESPLR
jgi:acyl carrier protein phosphodiesterase